ncbi:hypothetical protein VTN00DRAFT_3115 [Thermoascus crustaceus]|uniref:uncharacterized protein n=1 Tax=Thermoascus crustaceus TaxID=5088 RepID=UPI0037420C87
MLSNIVFLLGAALTAAQAVPPAGTVITQCSRPGVMALTFDDGPYIYEQQLVQRLNAAGAKATFFVTGTLYNCIYSQAEALRFTFASGHQISSHTWTHPDLSTLTAEQIRNEMLPVEQALEMILGVRPTYMRPPFGSVGGVAVPTLRDLGYRIVIWDIDSGDWAGLSPADSEARIVNAGTSGNGHIILMHEPLPSTVNELVPWALNYAQSNNLTLVTVAECLGDPVGPYIPNATASRSDLPITCSPTPSADIMRLFTPLRTLSTRRAFSTSRALRLELSYQVFEPDAKAKAGPEGNPIVFLHGLFGSKTNNRSISKVLARDLNCQIFTVDLRNHGLSPHATEHNYTVMAEDVEKFIDTHKIHRPVLIGHSMGAKTVMTVALRNPDLVSALIPVDNSPINAPLRSDFAKYVRGMKAIEEAKVSKQSDADKILQEYEPALPVRQFLLTNLIRHRDHESRLVFRVPLSTLANSLDAMADFPYRAETDDVQYDGPTLFIRGTRSRYVPDESVPAIKKFFPRARIEDVEAGHWLISENPEAFRKAVINFLREDVA